MKNDGTMREFFLAHKEAKRERRFNNLKKADPTGWSKHSEAHWWRMLNGEKLEYWPSSGKFKYQGKYMNGQVMQFIKKREKSLKNLTGE